MEYFVYDLSDSEQRQGYESLLRKNPLTYKSIKYFGNGGNEYNVMFIAVEGDVIVGISCIIKAVNFNKSRAGFNYCSVMEGFCGKGIGKKLLEITFEYVANGNWTIFELSDYSPMGFYFLKPTIISLMQKYPNLAYRECEGGSIGYPHIDSNGKAFYPKSKSELISLL